jgi:hypothetical protein
MYYTRDGKSMACMLEVTRKKLKYFYKPDFNKLASSIKQKKITLRK